MIDFKLQRFSPAPVQGEYDEPGTPSGGDGPEEPEVVDNTTSDTSTIISTSIVNTTKRADGKTVSKTINFINPKAADSDVATFMAALNSLSKNETIKGGLVVVEKRVL